MDQAPGSPQGPADHGPAGRGPADPAPHGGQSLPTCYRHPDRETGVRCTRCERPICPECTGEVIRTPCSSSPSSA
ncbi:hypothetical protein ABZ651_33340, partial [Streptomyces sp. NPDC007070]